METIASNRKIDTSYLCGMETQGDFWVRVGVFLVAFTAPLTPVMGAMVFLIIADFITAIYAAHKVGEKVQSSKMGRTVSKFFFYNLAVASAFVIEMVIIPEIPLMRVSAGFIAMTELRSIYENFAKIYGIDIWSKVKHLFSKKE